MAPHREFAGDAILQFPGSIGSRAPSYNKEGAAAEKIAGILSWEAPPVPMRNGKASGLESRTFVRPLLRSLKATATLPTLPGFIGSRAPSYNNGFDGLLPRRDSNSV